jgi:peroxisomal membrane protein 2
MAVINGAKSFEEIKRTVKSGFFSVIRVSTQHLDGLPYVAPSDCEISSKITWVASPLSMVIAQKFIPPQVNLTCYATTITSS